MQLKQFLQQLVKVAEQAPDAVISINGEYVTELAVTLHHPIAIRNSQIGMRTRTIDRQRLPEISLTTNNKPVVAIIADKEIEYDF